jgi:segregation and condensation protein B
MSIKAKLEALIYAAEEPITLDQMAALLREDLLALKTTPEAESQPEQTENQPAVEAAPETPVAKRAHSKDKTEKAELRALLKPVLEELVADYATENHGIEVREVASGYRMYTKPEHHDVVRAFSKSLKPPIRLSLQALETLAVIAYKQPVTVPEISEIRGVDASGVIGTLFDRKLITTAGRKAVVGRPMLYKTTKDFLMRFGLRDITELPSLEEFEKLATGEMQEELFASGESALPDATGTPDDDGGVEQMAQAPESVPGSTVSTDLHKEAPQRDKADEQAADQIASESTGG